MPVVRDEALGLTLGGADLAAIARDPELGTPTYVYDLGGMAHEARVLELAFEGTPHRVAYAVKANSAGPVVRALAQEGLGADVVSGSELALASACGVHADAILFSGVAKTNRELDLAIGVGPSGIGAIQIESVEEIPRVAARARALGLSRPARISLRVNPAVDLEAIDTHAHIATGHDDAKFGIPKDDLSVALQKVAESRELSLVGMSTHVGSQFTRTQAYLDAARALFQVVVGMRGDWPSLRFVDTGGGYGVDYGEGCEVSPSDFVRETRALKASLGLDDLALYIEPGRSLVARHGVLLALVLQHKLSPSKSSAEAARNRWLMIDAGMNDLLRPALYQARHRVESLQPDDGGPRAYWRVVGPVCESSDDFGAHLLPATPPGYVALLDAGAYGYTMASRYNGRSLPAEVFVRDGVIVSSRRREGHEEWARERASIGE